MKDDPVYVRPGAVCKALGISPPTLRRWCEAGAVRFVRFAHVRYHDGPERLAAKPMRRIELKSLLEFLEQGDSRLHRNARAKLLALKADVFVPPNDTKHLKRNLKAVEDVRKTRPS